MNVYRLRPILRDPRFTGFGWELPGLTSENDRSYDFTYFYPKNTEFQIPKLSQLWDYPEFTIQENVNPFNDFPCCIHVPVFSRRAVGALGIFLEKNGELLPVRSKFGDYYAYQTLTLKTDVLNRKKSDGMKLSGQPDFFYDLDRYEFYPSKLKGLSIFRIIEHPSRILVTSEFVECAIANKLLGFLFDPVWPNGEDAPEPVELKAKTLEKTQAKTLLVHIPIRGKSRTTQSAELAKTRQLLADSLVLTNPEMPYLGGLAGEIEDEAEIRILLPCNDPKKLLQHITPSLNSLPWCNEISATMWSSPYWDTEPDETALSIK